MANTFWSLEDDAEEALIGLELFSAGEQI